MEVKEDTGVKVKESRYSGGGSSDGTLYAGKPTINRIINKVPQREKK